METHIKNAFTDAILDQVGKLYEIEMKSLYKVGGFENFIYGFEREDKAYIVRISHSDHRTYDMLESELDFVFYLAHHGAQVSRPIFNKHQRLVEKIFIDDASYFTVSAYEKAKGIPPTKDMESEAFYHAYGKTIGQFHRLTKSYQVPKHVKKTF